MGRLTLDTSQLPVPETATQAESTYEPPRRVYFGPRDSNGRQKPEPVYKHIEFPKALYSKGPNDTVVVREVLSAEEQDKLGPNWYEDPREVGYIGAPTREQELAMQRGEKVYPEGFEPGAKKRAA
jgi:hypothetical protein